MSVNFLTKPILSMTSSDFANMLNEGAKRSRCYAATEVLNEGYITPNHVENVTAERVRDVIGDAKFYELFDKNGNITEKGQENLINAMHEMGYDYDSMMNVTIDEYLERCICNVDSDYVPKIDYMA